MKFDLKKNLTKHGLGDLARLVENQEGDISLADVGFDARLEQLLEELICERENKLINRLIKAASFKYPMASIESLDFDAKQAKKNTIINLAAMGFLTTATNLIITGPAGAGKTYLSCALGIEACKKTYRVFSIRMPGSMRNFEDKGMQRCSTNCLNREVGTILPSLPDNFLWQNGMAGWEAEHRLVP